MLQMLNGSRLENKSNLKIGPDFQFGVLKKVQSHSNVMALIFVLKLLEGRYYTDCVFQINSISFRIINIRTLYLMRGKDAGKINVQ